VAFCRKSTSAPPQALLPIAQQRRPQICDDPARTGLDLDGNGHARRGIDELVFDLQLGLIERNPRRVEKLLSLRFALIEQSSADGVDPAAIDTML
jgi:hypothetical protein